MAIIYVDSAAAGTNAGTSWTNAYTSIASSTGAAAGDFVYIERNHVEQPNANTTLTLTNSTPENPIKWLCVDKTNGALISSGTRAIVGTGTGTAYAFAVLNSIYAYGISFLSGASPVFRPSGNPQHRQTFEYCDFQSRSNSVVAGERLRRTEAVFNNCMFKLGTLGSWSPILIGDATKCTIINPSFDLPVSFSTAFISPRGLTEDTPLDVLIQHANLSSFDNLVTPTSLGWGTTRFNKCNLKSGYTVATTSLNARQRIVLESCSVGTISETPLGLQLASGSMGTASHSLSRYRTGGADDGRQVNAYSLEMAANANAIELYNPLEITLGSRWVGPKSSISAATAKGIFTSTACEPLATPAALTTDAVSTWIGTGVGTKQKISHTLSNGDTLTVYVASGVTLENDEFWIEVSEPDQVAGLVTVKAFLAKPSTTVYVDPKIEVV